MTLFFANKNRQKTEQAGADCPMQQPAAAKYRQAQSDDSDAQAGDPAAKRGLFARLAKTREGLFGGIEKLFASGKIDQNVFDDIEDQLLLADLGVAVSSKIMQRLRADASANKLHSEAVLATLRAVILEILEPCQPAPMPIVSGRPVVIMMVGVNGVGKTTTLAKIAGRHKHSGCKVMLAACDTFRAAAIEQLQTWGQRLDVPVIAQSHGADAAAVAFDAYAAARARNCELLLVDTAGRQHTHGDLMAQLKKVKRVLSKAEAAVPDQVWLTVDAGNGQNVLSQVEHFHAAVKLTGICVTKLDGTAKGGVVIALADRFGLPIRYLGVGESADALRQFEADAFVDALLPVLP